VTSSRPTREPGAARGRLRIGDDWNAITIIALSQSNPLKAIAELVENSIDAKARAVTITRGRQGGGQYLSIRDDGSGVPRDEDGRPDFRYVATHICDSVKRHLKERGAIGIQGEFGIGLLSFWTIGEALAMTCAGADIRSYQMVMRKGDPGYSISPKRTLVADGGTEVHIAPLLEGMRGLSGEKIQWYLASELRDRIRETGVRITVMDRLARKQYLVEPRQYEGQLLHQLPPARTPLGDLYAELYLNEQRQTNSVALFRQGTRVAEDLAALDDFAHPPWTLRFLQGHIDAPFVSLTPGTRTGLIRDAAYAALLQGLEPLERRLIELIEEQRRAQEERASRDQLRVIQRAFREALLALPAEEYDWFDIRARMFRPAAIGAGGTSPPESLELANGALPGAPEAPQGEPRQRKFFEFAGPLFTVAVSPASSIVRVGESRELRALPRDRARRRVERDLEFAWRVVEGMGALTGVKNQAAVFHAPADPGVTRVEVQVRQGDTVATAEAVVTISEELLAAFSQAMVPAQGLPGYSFERAAGESWRSRFDAARNLILVNNGHRDFVFASRSKALKLRYLVRLYAKELIMRNFAGMPAEQLLDRMIELSLRTEEHL
jgi:Histidine kinase-, DNA gyrase B-, and HSP90-like ATPase